MSVSIRMTRQGTKKRPYYHVVAADSRCPRDGRFIEKLGTYNPMLAKDNPERVKLNSERIVYWLKVGAEPSDRVARFLGDAGIAPKPTWNETPKKSAPKAKAVARAKENADKAAKAAAEAAKPAEAPAAE